MPDAKGVLVWGEIAEGRLARAIPPTTRAAEASRRTVMVSPRISQLRSTPKSGVVSR